MTSYKFWSAMSNSIGGNMAMKKAASKKGTTGNRYTDEQKKKVIAWYKARVASGKPGSVGATLQHFKISYIAFRKWLEAEDGPKTKVKQNSVQSNKPLAKAFKALVAIRTKEITVMEKIIKSLQ
jgi:hypothetical protein